MLNAQPLGFYSPSQLVQDLQRHDATVRPVDVLASDWDSTLEPESNVLNAAPALRLGLRLVGGLSQEAGTRIEYARRAAPFISIDDLATRAVLDKRDLDALARADALLTLAGHRREAYWQALAAELTVNQSPHLNSGPHPDSRAATLQAATEGHEVVQDYASTGLTLRSHPLALLRPRLAKHFTARKLEDLPDGAWARVAGIVTCRQRPGTAKGTVFVTLEDETGWINVIVWPDLVEGQRRELLAARLLGVAGRVQREREVLHLVARRLFDHSALLGSLNTSSRNFH